MTVVIRARDVTRTYGSGATEIDAVAGVSLEVSAGELVVLRGPSGAGKTTLLNILGGLDRPSSGSVMLDDVDITTASESRLDELRRTMIGFVFQSFALLPALTASENIEIPMRLIGTPVPERTERVAELLDLVGLSAHARQKPSELSGGQQQRVGVARALACRPRVLIADEPNGHLDSQTAGRTMQLFINVVHSEGVAAIISTHDPRMSERADRILELRGGRLTSS